MSGIRIEGGQSLGYPHLPPQAAIPVHIPACAYMLVTCFYFEHMHVSAYMWMHVSHMFLFLSTETGGLHGLVQHHDLPKSSFQETGK